MNKTTSILLVLFLGLGAGSWWYMSKGNPKTTMTENSDWNFAVKEVDQIERIFFADRKGKKVDLKREGKTWIYNDKYKARPNGIENILNAVSRVSLKYRPPHKAIQPMIDDLATKGIKVEVYGKNDKILKTYYVGGSTVDERGTFMIMEGSENPYVVHIPTWEGHLRGRFFFGDKNWRDRTVIAEEAANITSVSIEYPNKKNKSFVIDKEGETYSVRPFYEITPRTTKALNQGNVKAYLDAYKYLAAEGFENENVLKDSITAHTPFCIISLENKIGKQSKIKLYPIIDRDPNGKPYPDAKVERYLVKNENADYYLIQHLVFRKLLVAYDYFFSE